MLELLSGLDERSQFFNLFTYITFRTGGAMFTAMIIALHDRRALINWLRHKQGKGQPIREDGPQTPSADEEGHADDGRAYHTDPLCVSALLWADVKNPYVWSVLLVTVGFGAIGFVDDFAKVTKQKHRRSLQQGASCSRCWCRFAAILAMLAAEWIAHTPDQAHTIAGFWGALTAGDPLRASGAAVHERLVSCNCSASASSSR